MKYLGPEQRGSAGDQTASRNTAGQYYRARVGRGGVPLVPITDAADAWNALTDAQRNAWADWAIGVPKTDSLGQSYVLSGRQAFISAYLIATRWSLTPLTDPGTYSVPLFKSVTLVGDIYVVVALPGPTGTYYGEHLCCADFGEFFTGPKASAPGVMRPPGRGQYKRIYVIIGPSMGAGISFPAVGSGTTGQRVWGWVRLVDAFTYRVTPWVLMPPWPVP